MANYQVNPILTTNALGSFSQASDGIYQGVMYDDPAVRYALRNTVLAATETLPMWGGVLIGENIALPAPSPGPTCFRATTLANATGFSVFNQAAAWINTPQSECPSAQPGMTVPILPFLSRARIGVQIDPALISLDGGLITQQVSWDFNLQRLVPYEPAEAGIATTAVTWSNANGGTATVTTTSAHGLIVGDDVTLSGIVPTVYNGDVTVLTVPTTTTFTFALPLATTPGSATTQGFLNAGGGALNVRVLSVTSSNCMTVFQDSAGNVHWNRNGAAAIIEI